MIEIVPTETDIEKLEAGMCITLNAEDLAALRKLRQLQREASSVEWFERALFTDDYRHVYKLWDYLQSTDVTKTDPTRFRLNAFGWFILDLADGVAYLTIDND